jgi:hypothetical protein
MKMSGHIETVIFPDGGLPIHIDARPYPDNSNAILVTCTIKCTRGEVRELKFREVIEIF